MRILILFPAICLLIQGCDISPKHHIPSSARTDTSVRLEKTEEVLRDEDPSPAPLPPASGSINTGNVSPSELLRFAESLQGVPYKYASTDPREGFDCSGFITYVFNHFNIAVPRSSVEFTNIEKEIPLREARRGDLILFTGTDSTDRTVGHMGIITSAPGEAHGFIHSTSGKADGVTITPLNPYYQGRFVKTIRIFNRP